jgi:hypothetical protein
MVDRSVALAAAGLVVAGERRNALEQRRFAGAVLADDDGDGMVEGEARSKPRCRNGRQNG